MEKKALIPIVVCVVLLVASIGGNLWLWTSLDEANSKITELETTMDTHESEIETLEAQVTSLQADKNNLQSQVSWLDGNITNYKSQLTAKDAQILDLEDKNELLEGENTWLKQHSFTYYTVGDAINISNVGIFKEYEWWDYVTINGTITNISDKPIETVYVYLILRNPDGTAEFESYNYDMIENLYIGETEPFEFSYIYYDESQTVEIFLIY